MTDFLNAINASIRHEFQEWELMRKVFATLTPRQEKILRMRFAIGERREYSRKEIAEYFSISYSTVRRIEMDAITDIEASLQTEYGGIFGVLG